MSFDQWNNQGDVIDLGKWQAQQQAIRQLQAMQKGGKTKPKDKGNLLTHLLPTIGGTGGGIGGGAAGGALAGSAVLPGIGTVAGGLAGALIGGFAGGAGGKAVENKIEGKGIGSGVLAQGAEQGVLSAGPLRLLKGATLGSKAAVGALRDSEGLAGAINAAAERANTPMLGRAAKNLVTQGQQAQGRVSGISAGQKVANRELSPQDTEKMLQTLKGEGIKTGNANNTFRDLQDKLNNYGSQISEHFTNNNTPLTKTQVNGLAKEFTSSLKTTDPSVLKQAQVLANDMKKNVTDTKSLWEFRKTLDGRIPDSKFMDAVNTDKIAALKAMRQHITSQLGDVPGASSYHNLAEIKPFVSAEAKRLNNPGGGIVGRVAASGPVQKAEQVTGALAEKAGRAITPREAGNPFGPIGVAKRTVPVGLAQALSAISAPQQANPVDPQMTDLQAVAGAGPDALAPDSGDGSSGGSPYTKENLMADIQRDPKNADKYISTYNDLQDVFTPAGSKPLTGTQAQQANNAMSGLQSLQLIAQTLQDNPNAAKLASLPGGSLTGSVTHTGSYRAAVNNAADVIGRLRSGGAINQDEEKRFLALLPSSFDDSPTVQYKLSQLGSLFQSFANPQPANDSTDLASALMSAGYQ